MGDAHGLPKGFHQIAWVVPDLRRAERHWIDSVGVPGFFRLTAISAAEMGGTYRGEPGTWAMDVALGFHGDLMVELIRPIRGPSTYDGYLDAGRATPHHIGYLVGDIERAGKEMEAQGFDAVQTAEVRGLHAVYYDTTAANGLYTELIHLDEDGIRFFDRIRRGA